ncbi:MAG: hypothetical protein KKE36_09610 [Actinobacteria bacterium]|nr:hypothetical protein [Actinomycetota bacterium]
MPLAEYQPRSAAFIIMGMVSIVTGGERVADNESGAPYGDLALKYDERAGCSFLPGSPAGDPRFHPRGLFKSGATGTIIMV